MKRRLKPIGEGSNAHELGYDFDLLLSWLENIYDSESEKAETNSHYEERAEKLRYHINGLNELS